MYISISCLKVRKQICHYYSCLEGVGVGGKGRIVILEKDYKMNEKYVNYRLLFDKGILIFFI